MFFWHLFDGRYTWDRVRGCVVGSIYTFPNIKRLGNSAINQEISKKSHPALCDIPLSTWRHSYRPPSSGPWDLCVRGASTVRMWTFVFGSPSLGLAIHHSLTTLSWESSWADHLATAVYTKEFRDRKPSLREGSWAVCGFRIEFSSNTLSLNENELPKKYRFSKNSVLNLQTAHEPSRRLGFLSRTLLGIKR